MMVNFDSLEVFDATVHIVVRDVGWIAFDPPIEYDAWAYFETFHIGDIVYKLSLLKKYVLQVFP